VVTSEYSRRISRGPLEPTLRRPRERKVITATLAERKTNARRRIVHGRAAVQ
jgi:hypothetical protein